MKLMKQVLLVLLLVETTVSIQDGRVHSQSLSYYEPISQRTSTTNTSCKESILCVCVLVVDLLYVFVVVLVVLVLRCIILEEPRKGSIEYAAHRFGFRPFFFISKIMVVMEKSLRD